MEEGSYIGNVFKKTLYYSSSSFQQQKKKKTNLLNDRHKDAYNKKSKKLPINTIHQYSS
jgi:hypothetical protein